MKKIVVPMILVTFLLLAGGAVTAMAERGGMQFAGGGPQPVCPPKTVCPQPGVVAMQFDDPGPVPVCPPKTNCVQGLFAVRFDGPNPQPPCPPKTLCQQRGLIGADYVATQFRWARSEVMR